MAASNLIRKCHAILMTLATNHSNLVIISILKMNGKNNRWLDACATQVTTGIHTKFTLSAFGLMRAVLGNTTDSVPCLASKC